MKSELCFTIDISFKCKDFTRIKCMCKNTKHLIDVKINHNTKTFIMILPSYIGNENNPIGFIQFFIDVHDFFLDHIKAEPYSANIL
jgi:hypothetical protein